MARLSDYKYDVLALLHDQNSTFTSQTQLVRWINLARRQVAARTGCIRRLITGQSAFGAGAQPGAFIPGAAQPGALPGAAPVGTVAQAAASPAMQVIVGVERYPFRGFFNEYAAQQYAGVKGIVDVIDLSVNWGGAVRPALAWMPWEDLQAYARSYAVIIESYPYYWSVMNDGEEGEVWLFPTPSFPGDIEADAFCVPKDIYTDDDFDAVPDGFANAVKYYAAMMIYLTSQRFAQAQVMQTMLQDQLGVSVNQSNRGKTSNYYYSVF